MRCGGARARAGRALLPHERVAGRVVEPDDHRERVAVGDHGAVDVVARPGAASEACGLAAEQACVGRACGAEQRLAVEPTERLGVLECALDHECHLLAHAHAGSGVDAGGRSGEREHDHAVGIGRRIAGRDRTRGERDTRDCGGHGRDPRAGAAAEERLRRYGCARRDPRAATDPGEVRRVERLGERHRRGEPIGGDLRERALDGVLECVRDRRTHDLQRRRALTQMARDERLCGPAGEGRFAREHLVADATERVDVGTRIDDGAAAGLLRAHVRRCPQREADLGDRGPVGTTRRPRDPEVSDHRPPAAQQDVLRLDVAVDHARLMRVRECRGHVAHDRQRVGKRQLHLALEPVPQRLARHERHDEVEQVAAAARVEEWNDVRVLERTRDGDLALEPFHADRGRQIGIDDLHRELALVPQVARVVDSGHAAAPELVAEHVVRSEQLLKSAQVVGQTDPRCDGVSRATSRRRPSPWSPTPPTAAPPATRAPAPPLPRRSHSRSPHRPAARPARRSRPAALRSR